MPKMLQLPEGIVRILFENTDLLVGRGDISTKTIKGLFTTLKRFNRGAELRKEDFLSANSLSDADNMQKQRENKKNARAFVKEHKEAGTEFFIPYRLMASPPYEKSFKKVKVIGRGKNVKWNAIRVVDENGKRTDTYQGSMLRDNPENPFVKDENGLYIVREAFEAAKKEKENQATMTKAMNRVTLSSPMRYHIPGITD